MSSTVTTWLADGRSIDETSFADLTTSTVTSILFAPDGQLVVTFADTLTDDAIDQVQRRIGSATDVEEHLRATVAAQAAAIDAWGPIGTLTMLKINQRMDALTAQVQALTRLVQPGNQ